MITTIIPPQIRQHYDNILLSGTYKLSDDLSDLEKFYEYCKSLYFKKAKSGNIPTKQRKCFEIIDEYLELYERVKAKEKERKEQTSHFTQRPFYRFPMLDKKNERIYGRLRIQHLRRYFYS